MKISKKHHHASHGHKKSHVSMTTLHAHQHETGPSSSHSLRSAASMSQIKLQLFREAFHLIDQDGDGVISKDDLHCLYKSLGMEITDSEINEMLNEVSGQMNHAKFTCMLASRTGEVDDAQVLLNSFRILDKDGVGKISVKDLCYKLATVGFDRMKPDEINAVLKIAPVDAYGMLDYPLFVRMIRGEIQPQQR